MKKAGIVVDNWKLPIFRKNLDDAGYTHRVETPFIQDTTTINVFFEPEQFEDLQKVVTKSELDAKRSN